MTNELFPAASRQAGLVLNVVGNVLKVQVIASGLVYIAVTILPIKTKSPLAKATPCQKLEIGKVLVVHVMPSGLVEAFAEPLETVTKIPAPKVTNTQDPDVDNVLRVHPDVPVVELAAMVPVVEDTITKTPFPNATEDQLDDTGRLLI